ncbi:MAG: hypothetical protein SGBAC_000534 [Bacillariaceae sp.]
MNRITKSFLALLLVALASTTALQAHALHGDSPVKLDRSNPVPSSPHFHGRSTKKGSTLSAKRQASSTKTAKKSALKLIKKSSATPMMMAKGESSQPVAQRLEFPVPTPVVSFITTTTAPALHADPNVDDDSKPSEIPSDAPSLVPTSWGKTTTPTVVFPINDSGSNATATSSEFPTAPPQVLNRTVDDNSKSSEIPSDSPSLVPSMGWDDNSDGTAPSLARPLESVPTQRRALGLLFPFTETKPPYVPCRRKSSNAPTSLGSSSSSNAPSSADVAMPTDGMCGEYIVSKTDPRSNEYITIPPVVVVVVLLSASMMGIASYMHAKVATLAREGEGQEGQFVNN